MPIVADAAVAVRGDLSEFNQDLKRGGEQGTRTLGQQLKSVFSPKNLAVAGVAGGVALAGAITAGLAGAVKSLIDIERLNAQTDAAIRSTGGVANVTREGVEELSEEMESLTTIEREVVQEGANMLLTFTKVRNEVGEGNDIFDQATESALDMSVALGTDAKSAAMLLGKALNDPLKGMTAMTRAGIQFTDQQKDMIKAMVASGDLLGAQKIILAELETQFGGSAEAFANTTAGKIQRFQNDVGNMFESIILGAVKVSDWLGDDAFEGFAMNFGEQGDRVHDLAERMGEDFDVLKARIETRMDESGLSFEEAVREMELDAAAAASYIPTALLRMADEAAKIAKGERIRANWKATTDFLPQAVRDRFDEIRAAGLETQVQYAMGILDGQTNLKAQIEAVLRTMDERLSPGEEIAYLQGQLVTLGEYRGIADAADDPEGVAALDAVVGVVRARLGELTGEGYSYGYNLVTEYARGMLAGNASTKSPARAAYTVATGIGANLRIESEPKEGPLRGITKWGGNIVKTIADGIYGNLGVGSGAAAALAGALVPGMAVPGMALVGAGVTPAGGITYSLTLNGVGKNFNSEQDMLDALKDLSAFGEGRLS